MSAGRLILMGSGEVSGRLVATHRLGNEAVGAREVLVLDTPYGFQENAPLLSERSKQGVTRGAPVSHVRRHGRPTDRHSGSGGFGSLRDTTKEP